MPKTRVSIPVAIKNQLKAEYDHKCCMCGLPVTMHLHIHHIDENPSNNDVLNLLPLCPNCHLVDQHNPTKAIDPGILSLFRAYKDPTIVMPQFKPLYARMGFYASTKARLNTIDLDIESLSDDQRTEIISFCNATTNSYLELCEFVKSMNMGNFYAKEIHKAPHKYFAAKHKMIMGASNLIEGTVEANVLSAVVYQYAMGLAHISSEKDITDMIIEMLVFQGWLKHSRFPKTQTLVLSMQ